MRPAKMVELEVGKAEFNRTLPELLAEGMWVPGLGEGKILATTRRIGEYQGNRPATGPNSGPPRPRLERPREAAGAFPVAGAAKRPNRHPAPLYGARATSWAA